MSVPIGEIVVYNFMRKMTNLEKIYFFLNFMSFSMVNLVSLYLLGKH